MHHAGQGLYSGMHLLLITMIARVILHVGTKLVAALNAAICGFMSCVHLGGRSGSVA